MALGTLLPEALSLEGGAELTRISMWWFRAVPERFRQVSCPTSLRHGTVWVSVENSVWQQELEFVRSELLKTMCSDLSDLPLRDLRFHIA